jgi:hypothetical protein
MFAGSGCAAAAGRVMVRPLGIGQGGEDMGMAGWVRLGPRALRALPAESECEIELDGQGLPIAFAFDLSDAGDDAVGEGMELYPDLADAIAQDGGLGDLD